MGNTVFQGKRIFTVVHFICTEGEEKFRICWGSFIPAEKNIFVSLQLTPIFLFYNLQGVFLVLLKVICLFERVIFILEINRGCHLNP